MSTKLDIKHIAPYLPYGIFCTDIRNVKYTLKSLDYNKNSLWGYVGLATEAETNAGLYKLHEFKPILRPISDITREIEHNGKKLTPMKYFYEKYGGGHISYNAFVSCQQGFITSLVEISYLDAQKLFEWHFDLFGLIDQGLAVDYNEFFSSNNK